MWFDVPKDVLIVFLYKFLKGERVFIWMQSDCEINWVLFSLLFSLKSGFGPYPMKQTKFLHFLLHHFLQSKIWIQKVSGDAWSFLHIFCWNKWNMYLSVFSSLWRHLTYFIEVWQPVFSLIKAEAMEMGPMENWACESFLLSCKGGKMMWLLQSQREKCGGSVTSTLEQSSAVTKLNSSK